MDSATDTVDDVTPFPFPQGTANSLFHGVSRYTVDETDGHPEPLRLFREHGLQCPDGWYAVRPRMPTFRKSALFLLVEMNPPSPVNPTGLYARHTHRTLWYTPSPEHADEVARQLAAHERTVFRSYQWCILPLYATNDFTPHGRARLLRESGGWSRISVDIQVYRRNGDTPVLHSVRSTELLQRPRAV